MNKVVLALMAMMILQPGFLSSAQNNNGSANESHQDTVIPVLCYHRFGPIAKKNNYALTTAAFKQQLEVIHQEGFTPITPKQAVAALKAEQPWPNKPIMITVDDGYQDFITYAKPSLDEYGYKATLFVYTDFVGARLGFSRQDLKELTEQGFEIGSHSVSHSKLSKRSASETTAGRQKRLARELAFSREQLSQWSGREVVALAYPYGLWDQTVARQAKQAGYQLMFTVCAAPNSHQTEPYRWHRMMVVRGLQAATLRKRLQEWPLPISQRQPAPGERIVGPLNKITATLSPDWLSRVSLKSLVARSGRSVYPLKIDQTTGELTIMLTKPWTKGTDQLTLVAEDQQGRTYRDSWLMIVDPEK